MDLTAIDFPDICWRYGVFYCIRTGTGRDKKYCPWSGVKTALGEIEQKIWCQIAEALIERRGESPLLKCLVEWKTAHNYAHISKEEIRKEALQLHVARLFDNPLWADFVPFNRKYRPDALKSAHLVTVINECCKMPGEVTQEQIDHALNGTIACPCCGRWSLFHFCEEQMENEIGMEMTPQ
ncbi:hypothetical protein [Hominenteromicrobium sp.]|uniref:hypothetical protein n=1 Tax=Hominenteromicrobium sp. TaxID=3073581 RepID=UPI003AB59317